MNSVINWRGGKSKLAKRIVKLLDVSHICFIEAFCGAAWIMFAKDYAKSKHEVLNDKHEELTNFFEIIRTKGEELFESMQWDIKSRSIYNQLRNINPKTLSNVERARRFYWLTKCAFGGTYEDVFGTSRKGAAPANFDKFLSGLKSIYNRLKNVTIECKDYRALAKTYDDKTSLWYLDPPYLGTNKTGYADDIRLDEFSDFANTLKGKVAISHNVNENVRNAFKGWNFVDLGRRQNSIGNSGNKPAGHAFEWLITNYDPPSGAKKIGEDL